MTPEQIAALAAQAAATTDHTETKAGVDFAPPKEGRAGARFIEYIEMGKHPQKPYQGKAKPDEYEVRLTFELLGGFKGREDVREIDTDSGKKTVADRISLKLTVKQGEKAAFKKLFEKMRRGRDDIKHMAQMLNEPFMLTIIHNKSEDGKKTYANIRDKDGNWLVSAPRVLADPLDDNSWVNVPVRERVSDLKIFLFDNPTKETWASLFIDGTREVTKEDGTKENRSKNWIQETIMSAKNFHGSALESLLNDISDLSIDPTGDAPADFSDLPEETGTRAAASADDLAEIGL